MSVIEFTQRVQILSEVINTFELRRLNNYLHKAAGMSNRVKSKDTTCWPKFLDILRWFYASAEDAPVKTEMSWVDTFSWFLTVTFDAAISCDTSIVEKQMSTFSAGLGSCCPYNCVYTSVCPYTCVSPPCVHTTVRGWAIVFGSSRTMKLEWGVDITVFERGVSIYNTLSGSLHIRHQCKSVLTGFDDTQQTQTKTLSSEL